MFFRLAWLSIAPCETITLTNRLMAFHACGETCVYVIV